MAKFGRDDGLDLNEIRHVERIGVGSLNPNRPVTEEQRDDQIAFLNRCLNDVPRGKIIGREISTAMFQVGEHQITMQLITYHVGFTRKPLWLQKEEKTHQTQTTETPQLSPDDFTIIEGIDPEAQQLLHRFDILTYAKLATTTLDRLEKILLEGSGSEFLWTTDPRTWSLQAALAATGQWDELDLMKKGLRELPSDDFIIIEGIGPKTRELLHNAGIRTYYQLAKIPREKLQHILKNAGSAFGRMDPTTWSHQAALAATEQWDELDLMKREMKAGHRITDDDAKET